MKRKQCRKCKQEKAATREYFSPQPAASDGLHSYCKRCCADLAMNRYRSDVKVSRFRLLQNRKKYPERWLLYAARQRAARRGVPCTITEKDIIIPNKCPIFGTPLKQGSGIGKRGSRKGSATLDCVDPSKGYVPGNIMVVSHRANMLKSNATVAEIEQLLSYMKSFT